MLHVVKTVSFAFGFGLARWARECVVTGDADILRGPWRAAARAADGRRSLAGAGVALLAALGAVATVYCTSMIYRSLKPVPRWHNGWVVPNYLALALMTGLLWLAPVLQVFGARPELGGLVPVAIALAAVLKTMCSPEENSPPLW